MYIHIFTHTLIYTTTLNFIDTFVFKIIYTFI